MSCLCGGFTGTLVCEAAMACLADTALEQLYGLLGKNNCRGQVRKVGLLRPALPTPRRAKRLSGAPKRMAVMLASALSKNVEHNRVAQVKRKSTSQKLGGVTPAPHQCTWQKPLAVQKLSKAAAKVTTQPVQLLEAAHVRDVSCPPPNRKRRVDMGEKRETEHLVGRGDETVADHRKRHPALVSGCARCHWLQWGEAWRRKQGSSFADIGGRAERIEWVAERPARLGGLWGLGCSVCARAVIKLRQETSLRARGCLARIATKWASFEVRPASLQASHLAQHAGWQSHKLALDIFLAVDTPVREVIADAALLSEQELLKGSVPQPADWLRAWRYMKEGASFRRASRFCTTEEYIHGICPAPSRKVVKALPEVMVEKIREDKRNWLKQAVAVALLVDDRGAYKLVRFRCDHGTSFKTGVLGVAHRGGCGGVTPLERWDDDFCEREAETVMQVIKRFCTSNVHGVDEGLLNHLKECVRVYVSDGCAAVLKTGRVLKHTHFRNLGLIVRDPAHAIRIAARDPLLAEEKYGHFWTEMFDSKHALVRDVQSSDQFRAKLESCQDRVKEVLGSQGGGLQSILRHMSAAKQRFESFASPARRYCLMLNALALLLAVVASDSRKDRPTRERAEKALESMTPESIVIAGLTADYTAECLDFVRAFDRTNVDPATIASVRDAFVERMQALFLQGFAALEPPEDAQGDRTMLQICMAQVADMPVFHYNDKRHCLWSSGAAAQVKELMARMAAVVQPMIERVKAELGDDDIICQFVAFRLAEWSKPDLRDARMLALRQAFKSLCKCVNQDPLRGHQEFAKVLPAAIEAFRVARAAARAKRDAARVQRDAAQPCEADDDTSDVDNRVIWGQLLPADLMVGCKVLPIVIRLYLAVPLGTPDVERGLGRLSSLLTDHDGPLSADSAGALVEGALDGPDLEEELFTKQNTTSQFLFRFTDFSRDCQRLWIQLHGRRFGTLTKTATSTPKKPKLGSEISIQRGRRRAATALVKRAANPQTDAGAKCFGGLQRSQLAGTLFHRAVSLVAVTPAMRNFQERTKQIAAGQKKEANARRLGLMWCAKPRARKARKEVVGPPEDIQPATRIRVVPMRTSADFSVAPSPRVSVLPSTYASVRIADVIIVDDLQAVERCETYDVANLLVYAVGLGKVMVQQRDWQGDRPDEGPRALRFQARCRSKRYVIVASQHIQRHANIMIALRACAQCDGSKWSVVTEVPVAPRAQALVRVIDALPSLRKFLLSERRFRRHRGENGTFQRCVPP